MYYWKSAHNFEVDFIIKEGTKVAEIIQVCADISKDETQRREIRGVLEAATEFNLKKVLIITGDFSGELKKEGIKIIFIPLWRWLIL